MGRWVRWVVASSGPKPGARKTAALLLEAGDLPGGWKKMADRTWRTGNLDPKAGWAIRARKARRVTAWRSFRNIEGTAWLWCQVTPLADEADARSALRHVPGGMLRNQRSAVKVTATRDVDPPDLPSSGGSWAHEQETDGGKAGPGVARYVAAQIDDVLMVVAGSGDAAVWPWDAVAATAKLQAERILDRA